MSSSVCAIRDFPIGCGPNPNWVHKTRPNIGHSTHHHHHEDNDIEDYEPFEDLDDLNEITGELGLDPKKSEFEFGLKRKAWAIRDFPPRCGKGGLDNRYEYLYEEEPDYWFDMIIDNEEDVIVDEVPVGSGLNEGLGNEKTQENEERLIVLALVAPMFCPWRNNKGRVKKGKKPKDW